MASAFLPLASEFHYSLVVLGLFSAAFFVGNAAFQVPAGILSAHRGARFTTILALTLITAGSFLSAVDGHFYFQLVMRFVTGFGAAFFFAPAMMIAAGSLNRTRSSLTVGMYNFPFSIGAGLALLIFTPLAVVNWRLVFVITGILTLIALIENSYALKGGFGTKTRVQTQLIRKALTARDVWIALICVLGTSASFYILNQFLVSYSENELHFTPSLAGIISSVALLGVLLGSPVGGWLSDKFGSRRRFIMIFVVGGALSIGLLSVHISYLTWMAVFTSGLFFAGANTGVMAYPLQLGKIGTQYIPITVGLMNGIGTMVGAAFTAIFPILVGLSGFDFCWIVMSLMSLVFAPIIYLAVEPNKSEAI